MKVFEMYKTYGNIKRLRQILTVLAKHGFSHILHQMRIFEYAPWLGRLIEPKSKFRETEADLPTRLANAFQELGPAFVKLGQLLATRPDIVNPSFQRAFAKLQDDVQPLPGDDIAPLLEKSLGKPLEKVFAEFSHEAAAAGSIGQAHYATLLSGDQVVVKIKRPDIDKTIEEDLSLLESLAELLEKHVPELAAIRPAAMAGEFRRTMEFELDFVGEASCTAKFAASQGDNPAVKVPEVYWDYVSREVLVTERLAGIPLSQAGTLPENARRTIASILTDSFLHQFFVSGFFHADPHPGNIFILPGNQVGLLDFGQVGRLSDGMRHTLASMLLALNHGDADAIVDLYSELGEFAPDADISGFRQDLATLIDRNYGVPADRIDLTALSQEALSVARRNGLRLPRDFVMIIKSLVTVAAVTRGLDPDFRLDKAVEPFAKRLVLSLYNPAAIAKRGWNLAAKFASLFRRVPDDARDLLEKARAGKFTIVFHHENLNYVADRTGRAMDRLALGIIAASIVIASSIVLVAGPRSAPGDGVPLLGGIPFAVILAGFGFFAALVMAAWLVWGIFRDKS